MHLVEETVLLPLVLLVLSPVINISAQPLAFILLESTLNILNSLWHLLSSHILLDPFGDPVPEHDQAIHCVSIILKDLSILSRVLIHDVY